MAELSEGELTQFLVDDAIEVAIFFLSSSPDLLAHSFL